MGLITARQALDLEMSRDTIRGYLDRGRWIRVERGVYRVAGAPFRWDQRALAVCLSIGPDAALSHEAAGAIHGLPGFQRDRIEVVLPPGSHSSAATKLAVVHRPRHLATVDLCFVGPFHLTAPARTVIDEAGSLSELWLRRVVDHVLCSRLVSREHFIRRVQALTGKGKAGSGLLRHVLEVWTPGPTAESQAEVDVIRYLVDHGLPTPVLQHQVLSGNKAIARLDMAWPGIRLALELDSETWHDTPSAYHKDKARSLRLAAAGWEVLAVTPRNLREGSGKDLVSAIRGRLAAARPVGSGNRSGSGSRLAAARPVGSGNRSGGPTRRAPG
jgi:very-short-patch-repair endonuclease